MKIITIKSKVGTPWLKLSQEEIKNKVIELAKKGYSKSEIGAILRDQYGVPNIKLILKKKISKILEEEGLKEEIPEDLLSLYKKAVMLHQHLLKERKDYKSRRAFVILENRIKSLIAYYKRKNKLPKDYEYSIEKARLVVRI
ncbi:MAG: 30S ribosomal protein S15 [Candidatus Rehaiarchaeum fermentans]|nr:30S ribosomal protein S15 [Candidatus Rehaiarchaeum fermentans]